MATTSTTLPVSGLPIVIIAGVHKAGTTSLFEYLARHPQVCPARIKELRYFSRIARDDAVPDMHEYDSYFTVAGAARYRLEASPNYIYGKEKVAQLIRQHLPDAKIIVILREPVERLLSLYNRALAHSELPRDFSFADYVEASLKWQPGASEHYVYTRGLRDGFYIDYLQPWQDVFEDDLKILFLDDLTSDSFRVTADVCEWLGLDTGCMKSQSFDVENRTLHYRHMTLHQHVAKFYMKSEAFWRKHRRIKRVIRAAYNRLNRGRIKSPTVSKETIEKLQALYAPYNARLREFLVSRKRVSLPDWLR